MVVAREEKGEDVRKYGWTVRGMIRYKDVYDRV